MEKPHKKFSELVEKMKSWSPRRSEPANISRDFWMPDGSCRVCYECDSQFTVFNRRHHCRLCGRIFCAKCTSNFVLVPLVNSPNIEEEGDRRIRVCNYCFKQWEQEVGASSNCLSVSSPVLSPSLSTTSWTSSKSSGTVNSNITTAGLTPYTSGAYDSMLNNSGHSLITSLHNEPMTGQPDKVMTERNMDSIAGVEHHTHNDCGFSLNSSDNDDEDDDDDDDDDDDIGGNYNHCYTDIRAKQFETSNDYFGSVNFDKVRHGYYHHEVNHPTVENYDAQAKFSSISIDTEVHGSLEKDKAGKETQNHSNYECSNSSGMHRLENAEKEQVDFEKNICLWLPPDPENEEDEKESSLVDDDGEDAIGEWGYLQSSNFCGGEYQTKSRSSEEHKKAMKNVVDDHFRVLVAQLLQVENLPVTDDHEKDGWLDIISSLSWEAASLLKPDTSKGGGMDPGGYVKVKCIAYGSRKESMVIKGVVCKKNVAHRRMSSRVDKPRLLILGGALEYQRVTNLLSSFDTLLQQEMDHLKMAVAKIDAHHPNVLLVEKSVSRFAQDYLLAKNISLVLNVKRPLLERIARCTGAQIVPSVDHMSSPKLGHCDLFHVEKYLEEHGSAGQNGKKLMKTLMFFEGCPKPLGCTILLKGGNGDELKRVKHVIQYGVFAAYHLALETSFLADEGASLPELPLKSPITVALPDKPSTTNKSISTVPGFTFRSGGKPCCTGDTESPGPTPDPVDVSIDRNGCVSGRNQQFEQFDERQSAHSINLTLQDIFSGFRDVIKDVCHHQWDTEGHGRVDELDHIDAEAVRTNNDVVNNGNTSLPNCQGSTAVSELGWIMTNDTQTDKTKIFGKQPGSVDFWTAHQDNNDRNEYSSSVEHFSPSSDHQSILVSLTSRCIWKGTVCERAHLFRIKYYGTFDKPLGRYLRDHLFDQSYRCRSCEMPSEAHVQCYTHRQGSLTISVKKLTEFLLPGERDGKIWMWHRCLRCPRIDGFPPATRRVVMSDAAWGLSFGKFLELSFSNHAAASRVANCGHSLHRDCLRFYGFGRMIACFRYAPVYLHSVFLPPPMLDFSSQHQEWMQKEANEVAHMGELLFSEILNALCKLAKRNSDTGSLSGKVTNYTSNIIDLVGVLKKEKEEFEESFHKLVRKVHPEIDILEINKLRRQLLFLSFLWDQRLILASGSESSNHLMLGIIMTKNKDKVTSTEKLVDSNLVSKPFRSSTSLDSINSEFLKLNVNLVDLVEGSLDRNSQTVPSHQVRDANYDSVHRMGSKNHSPAYMARSTVLDPIESGSLVRRVLSDGQFPLESDLSGALDARWIGENRSRSSEVNLISSSSLGGTSTSDLISETLEQQIGTDRMASTDFSMGTMNNENLENLSNWIKMPFVNFYNMANKTLGKLDILYEYTPVHISSFRELEHQGGARFLLPTGVNGIVIPIYDDEPTSIISYALVSSDYLFQISYASEKTKNQTDSSFPLSVNDVGNGQPVKLIDESSESIRSSGLVENNTSSKSGTRNLLNGDTMVYNKALHIRVCFSDYGSLGKVKYTVTCYYAKHFDSLRKACCPSELDFIRSLSRCKKWGAQGGKSNVFFAKSMDDRFIVKQVTKTELESFIKFAPEYFKYLSESISTGSPTCLAKILGIYQVTIKHVRGGKESRMDLLVMENLLFGRNVTRLYDLKGSSRSRYNSDCTGNNKVLLDQNLIEAMPTSPIFVGHKAKRLLERAVWNDTSFLASIDVMDYSLLVGVDEEKHELILGIIDFMRQYTWDKHLETWVKASGILGGPKNVSPTVISPEQYKRRFRKAMSGYFLVVPDQWSPAIIINSKSQSDLSSGRSRFRLSVLLVVGLGGSASLLLLPLFLHYLKGFQGVAYYPYSLKPNALFTTAFTPSKQPASPLWTALVSSLFPPGFTNKPSWSLTM